jgi:hypothetical protein
MPPARSHICRARTVFDQLSIHRLSFEFRNNHVRPSQDGCGNVSTFVNCSRKRADILEVNVKKALAMCAGAFLLVLATIPIAGAKGTGGVSGPAFYVDGDLYRTVGTPTDLSGTGAPAQSFDIIYSLGGSQLNVAAAAPGDRDYNGGRWMVHAISFNTNYSTSLAAHDLDGDGVFDSDAEILSALGDAGPSGATDGGVVQMFVCPVIPLH